MKRKKRIKEITAKRISKAKEEKKQKKMKV
jgi:hypothetical protein